MGLKDVFIVKEGHGTPEHPYDPPKNKKAWWKAAGEWDTGADWESERSQELMRRAEQVAADYTRQLKTRFPDVWEQSVKYRSKVESHPGQGWQGTDPEADWDPSITSWRDIVISMWYPESDEVLAKHHDAQYEGWRRWYWRPGMESVGITWDNNVLVIPWEY